MMWQIECHIISAAYELIIDVSNCDCQFRMMWDLDGLDWRWVGGLGFANQMSLLCYQSVSCEGGLMIFTCSYCCSLLLLFSWDFVICKIKIVYAKGNACWFCYILWVCWYWRLCWAWSCGVCGLEMFLFWACFKVVKMVVRRFVMEVGELEGSKIFLWTNSNKSHL